MLRKTSLLLFTLTAVTLSLCAQNISTLTWWDPAETPGALAEGIGWPQAPAHFYSRLPQDALHKVRKEVFDLSAESAGVRLRFRTDADSIVIEYGVAEPLQFPHMPATGVSGIDLYDSLGRRLTGVYQFSDTIRYRYFLPAAGKTDSPAVYTLYLPLYNTVKWLRIGAKNKPIVTASGVTHALPIVIYGTSIAQGACASRPGMAWSNILERLSGYGMVNLGFSGNGRLEPEVIDYVNEVNAAIYILDCLPNLTDQAPGELEQRIVHAVGQIRSVHPATPIILAEHAGFGDEDANFAHKQLCLRTNRALRNAMAVLHQRKIKNLYILGKKAIGLDGDCFVDSVHPNDAGMLRYAHAYLALIRQILAPRLHVKKV